MIVFELFTSFTSFNSFSLQCLLRNTFKTSNKLNKIWL